MLPNTQDMVMLVNAHIVDVEQGGFYPPQVNLVIQNGKILAMPGLPGEPEQMSVDAVIDMRKLTIIPSLFNTHCHIQFMPRGELGIRQIDKNMHDCVDRGITNIRDTLSYEMQDNQALMDRIKKGELLGPRIHQAVHVSPLGGTYAPHLKPLNRFYFSLLGVKLIDYKLKNCGTVVFPPEASLQQVRDAVDRAVDERGATAIKFCDQLEHFITYKPGAKVISFAQLEAAVDQANKRGLPTTMHNVTAAGFRQGIKAGLTSLAHIPIDGELEETDAELLLNSQTHIEPTLTVGYYLVYSIKGSGFQGHPDIQRVEGFREQNYEGLVEEVWLPAFQPGKRAMRAASKEGKLKVFGVIDISQPFIYYAPAIPIGGKNVSLLVKHGAASRMGCGNDAGPSDCSPASIHLEMSMFDFMLNRDETPAITPADLLRTATIQSARAMGMEDRFGSIRPGKTADLVILGGDPLQDYHLIGKPVQALFMDGKLVINRCGLVAQQPQSMGLPTH